MATYTCRGSVRGACGVTHKSIDTAIKCCAQDDRDVKRGHGGNAYSDRRVVRSDGADLTEHEMAFLTTEES